jgi:hypothetical protein
VLNCESHSLCSIWSPKAYFCVHRDDISVFIVQSVEPLPCHDCELGEYTTAVSGLRLGKHSPVARQQILNNNAIAERNNRRTVFSMWSVPRCYKQGIMSVQSVLYRSL